MRSFILTSKVVGRLGGCPLCKACGRVLEIGEKIYRTEMGGGQYRNYFCAECIETKPLLVYAIGKRRPNLTSLKGVEIHV